MAHNGANTVKTIYLTIDQVPASLRHGYNGKKFAAQVCDSVSLTNTWWDGGSRNSYSAYSLETGQFVSNIAPASAPSAFGNDYNGAQFDIKPGIVVIKHSVFCGKDMGLTFYVNPENAAKLLPDQSNGDLSDAELCLLDATAGLKSSYAGRKPRIEMMRANGFSMADIETAKQSLIGKKLLRGNGSITPAGRNACPERGKFKRW